MKHTFVGIFIWKNRAYLPRTAFFIESGIGVETDPVYTSDLNVKSLSVVIEKVRAVGNPQLPDPETRTEIKKYKGTIMKATKAGNWKKLAKNGATYDISWDDKQVRIDMSCLDERGRFINDPNKVTILPPNTPLKKIVGIILKDIKTRPELEIS